MKTPIFFPDLEKLIKRLPDPASFPLDEISIGFNDSVIGNNREQLFLKRKVVRNGQDEFYWTALCTVAYKR